MPDNLNFQMPSSGFDSYLDGIVPHNQAVTAGAFSVSMQQVRNIDKVSEAPAFAKVVYSMESIIDLPNSGGTNKPTDQSLASQMLQKQALGSGVYGTYTMSNFFGAMSGLPYPLKNIYESVKQIETTTLKTIYQNLYLAVTWEQATATWNGSTFTYTNRGGGYGRGGAAAPTVTVGGNSAKATIGTDPNDIGTYGKIISISYSGAAGIVVIAAPPGGGWPAMNTVVQGYINQANAEITAIKNSSKNTIPNKLLNAYWNITGTALKHEQRARYLAMPPVSIPYDNRIGSVPASVNSLVDKIPNYAKETQPNMTAQILEHISDLDTAGGQSIVAMLREARNNDRLAEVGIEQDNNLPGTMDIDVEKQLMLNGTVPDAVEGIESPDGSIYTIPANPVDTTPYNYYDDGLKVLTGCAPGSILPILDGDANPIVNECSPVGPGPEPPLPINPFVINPNVNTFPPPNLNSDYTGTTLMPSIYNIDDAIDKVIECNCDCWVK